MTRYSDIIIAGSGDRIADIKRVCKALDLSAFAECDIALKANFNSSDPPPASTHIETLDTLYSVLLDEHPRRITLAERSGMGNTRSVLEECGAISASRERGVHVQVLDELDRSGWKEIQSPGLHWSRGFFIAAAFAHAERVVQTCCLKTHRFGGNFTMSLKNSVGLIARRVPGISHDFMGELHSSPNQRLMIAEINGFYRTDLIVMDALDGFSTGGPDKGRLFHPGVMMAGNDRVAMDAAGVALLRSHGSTHEVMKGRIFEQEQIARGADLGIGIASASAIRLVPLDKAAEGVAARIQVQLDGDS